MANRAGDRQKRPFTIQEWHNGKWKSERRHWAHLDNAIECARGIMPRRVVRNRSEVMFRNAAALTLEHK